MKFSSRLAMSLFALVMVAGCASTKVTQQSQPTTARIARPGRIWVYDFVATPAEVPPGSAIAGQFDAPSAPQTPQELAMGRQLGAQIARDLVAKIVSMGLPAVGATKLTSPQVGDLVIRGYLLSIEAGSAVKRVAIGFGAGGSGLETAVEGYLMTAQGLRRLGSGTIQSGGSKTPGAALPAVVAIASGNPIGLIVSSGMKVYGEASGGSKVEGRAEKTAEEIAGQLKIRFQDQGWIM